MQLTVHNWISGTCHYGGVFMNRSTMECKTRFIRPMGLLLITN